MAVFESNDDASGGGITWYELTLTDSVDADPNAIYVSIADQGAGEVIITQDRVGQYRGPTSGWVKVIDLPDGLTLDGDTQLLFRIERIDLEPTNNTSGLWLGIGLVDNAGSPGNVVGPGFVWNGSGSKWYLGSLTRTVINRTIATLADADRTVVSTVTMADDFATSNEMAGTMVTAAKVGVGSNQAAMIGSVHKIILCGGNYITDTAGNSSMRWKLEVGVQTAR